jgi:hypothetical protein
MIRSQFIRCWLWVLLVVFAVGMTLSCAAYPRSYYESSSGYYSSEQCRTVNTVVREDGVVVRDYSRLVCAEPRYRYNYY